MIEERFIKRAIEIRKTYLKVTRDISVYESRAKKTLATLENTMKKLSELQDNIKNKVVTNVDDASKKLMNILTEGYRDWETDRKSTRLNSSHSGEARMPSSA